LTYKALFHIVESMKIKFLSAKTHRLADKMKEAEPFNSYRNPKAAKPE